MYAKEFKNLRPIVRKTGKKVKIISKVGIPFYLYRNRKRKAAAMGIGLFFVMLYICSLFVWNIGFEGNLKYTDQQLLEFVQASGYHHGMQIKSVECEALEKEIRNAYSDITWVSVRLDGTRLMIKIKENANIEIENLNKDLDNEDLNNENLEDVTNLVALNSGTVRYIATRQGTPKVHVNDVVEKGDVLVSGTVEIIDDYGSIIATHTVIPDADIRIEYEIDYEEVLSCIYEKRNYEKIQTRPILQIGMFRLPQIPFWNYDGLETELVEEVKQFHLFENFYLPIYYGIVTQKGYVREQAIYEEDYIKERANIHLSNYFDKLQKLGVEIIENNVKIVIQGNVCLAKGKLLVWDTRADISSVQNNEDGLEEKEVLD